MGGGNWQHTDCLSSPMLLHLPNAIIWQILCELPIPQLAMSLRSTKLMKNNTWTFAERIPMAKVKGDDYYVTPKQIEESWILSHVFRNFSIRPPEWSVIDEMFGLSGKQMCECIHRVWCKNCKLDAQTPLMHLSLLNFPYLRVLNLSYCKGFKSVALPCAKNLELLVLSGCHELMVITGPCNLPALTTLNLSDCPQLTDMSFLRRCPLLERLVLRGCNALTDISGLSGVLQQCRASLNSLNIVGCTGLGGLDTSSLDASQTTVVR